MPKGKPQYLTKANLDQSLMKLTKEMMQHMKTLNKRTMDLELELDTSLQNPKIFEEEENVNP